MGAEATDAKDLTEEDKAGEDTFQMQGVQRDVEIQVHQFLVECSFDATIDNCDGQVHEVHHISISFKLSSKFGILNRVWGQLTKSQ